jgi:hypothetical protein
MPGLIDSWVYGFFMGQAGSKTSFSDLGFLGPARPELCPGIPATQKPPEAAIFFKILHFFKASLEVGLG